MEDVPADETPNQRQARLRRERRAAKIQAEGNSRLEAITNLSGRKFQAGAETPAPTTATPPPANPALYKASVSNEHQDSPDPEEIDISEHHYVPRSTPRGVSSSTMQQWQGAPQPPSGFGGMGNMQQQMPPDMANDPMMRMMQQMMGGGGAGGGPGGGQNGDPMQGMPPMFADMMNAMGGAGGGPATGLEAQTASSSTYIWRIIHALFSFTLAIYVTLGTSFNGSKSSRDRSYIGGGVDDEQHFTRNLFVYFATAEVALQSGRYLIEKGQLAQSGLMGTLSRLLPEPYAGYIRVAGRYSVIYNTVVADAMVVVFVLGLVAWWKGQVEY